MQAGKICVSLAGIDAAALCDQARHMLDKVDVIEVRLDSMMRPDVAKCSSLLRKPLLFTNRPLWEGGAYDGSEDERIQPLLEAVQLRAAYIDFELRADQQLREALLKAMQDQVTHHATRMILSWHDFDSTPAASELAGILQQMMDSGAQVGKIVTTAHGPQDVLRVLRLQEQAEAAGFPLSCFCMGEPGRISRLATLYLGGYMTYACLTDEQATAAGQLSVEQLQTLTSLLAST
ncbi:MAG: type I 3-dehydroquinate dehydratase [Candidatus Electrothrix sp. AR4]|nr:type I 3-dehydroquinate dehydratase [Candidatus Electrothrix sp. AR4]